MRSREHDVIVIGGGISGLTAAWRLDRAGVDVCVLEASSVVGGAMRSERREGFLLEKGPFNVIVRGAAFEQLLDELGDELEVVAADRAAGRARYVLHGRRLCKVPSNPGQLLTTPLLTPGGKVRLIRGLIASRRGIGADDSIHEAATRRFGRQVADRLVSAMCVGIFAGDSRQLSLAGCFPNVAEIDTRTRSPLVLALSTRRSTKRKEKGPRRGRGLVSFREGLGALPRALAERLGPSVLTNCAAQAIRVVSGGYEVQCTVHDGEPLEVRCRNLVLALPQAAACALLGRVAPEIVKTITAIPASSVAVLNLGFAQSDVGHPLHGYGFLVPHTEPTFPLLGVLWADSVFPHLRPPDRRLLRVFVGGPRRPELLARGDAELVEIVMAALAPLLRLSGDPVLIDVVRWPDALPQYTIGHGQRLARVRQLLGQYPRLELIGNYLEGISISDCVRTATRAAQRITRDLGANERPHGGEATENDHEAAVERLVADSSPEG